jgi:hypothetical protein
MIKRTNNESLELWYAEFEFENGFPFSNTDSK